MVDTQLLLSSLTGEVIELNISKEGWVICSVIDCSSSQVRVELDPDTEEWRNISFEQIIGLRVDF